MVDVDAVARTPARLCVLMDHGMTDDAATLHTRYIGLLLLLSLHIPPVPCGVYHHCRSTDSMHSLREVSIVASFLPLTFPELCYSVDMNDCLMRSSMTNHMCSSILYNSRLPTLFTAPQTQPSVYLRLSIFHFEPATVTDLIILDAACKIFFTSLVHCSSEVCLKPFPR